MTHAQSTSKVSALQSALGLPERYTVEQPLGTGAFGEVFLVRDAKLQRKVAVKVLNCFEPERCRELAERFLREARILAELDHCRIPKIHDLGELPATPYWSKGAPFIVMQYFPGGNLDQYRKQPPNNGTLSFKEAARLVAEAAEGIDYAHASRRHVLHLDLKPQNIFLTEDRHASVGDWGLAAYRRDLRDLSSFFAGTLEYAAPEQIHGEYVDTRTDVWALGVILYQLLTGELPFEDPRMLAKISRAKYKPPRQHDSTIPRELDRICRHCLRVSPDDRYSSAGDLALSLRSWMNATRRSGARPFCVIQDALHLFGRPDHLANFAPTEDEYGNGLVHRPEVADTVQQRLCDEGWALVRGRGAAGKTTLALQLVLASESPFRDYLVYYLNIQDTDCDDAPSAIEKLAHEDVLFVVDNIHLDEDLAGRIHRRWEESDAGSHLLMLGRVTEPGPDIRGVGHPLDHLKSEELLLKVRCDDLAGVFRRLANRANGANAGISEPSLEVLQEWMKIFGGDLIAFSTAVAHRMSHLQAGRLTLHAEHAARYVRSRYLKDALHEEREALVRLAALADIELPATENAMDFRYLAPFIRDGLVLHTELPRWGDAFCTLVHPGFADLIWSAAGASNNLAAMRIDLARSDACVATSIACRLNKLQRDEETGIVLRILGQKEPTSLRPVIAQGLTWVVELAKLFARHKIMTEADFGDLVHANRDQVVEAALSTGLGNALSFLRYTQRRMQVVHESLIDALADETVRERVIPRVFHEKLGYLSSFLDYVRDRVPTLHEDLVDALNDERNRMRVVPRIFRERPAPLTSFLDYASRHIQSLYESMVAALRDEANLACVIEAVLSEKPGQSVIFLRYAREHIRELHAEIAKALADDANRERVVEAVFEEKLVQLAHFIHYVRKDVPVLHDHVVEALTDEANRDRVIDAVFRENVGHLSYFLRTARGRLRIFQGIVVDLLADETHRDRLVGLVFKGQPQDFASFVSYAVDANLTNVTANLVAGLDQPKHTEALREWLVHPRQQIENLPMLARSLIDLDRPNLAKLVARQVIRRGQTTDKVGLDVMLCALQLGHEEGADSLLQFLDRTVPTDWLDRQYGQRSLVALAETLFNMGVSQNSQALQRFRHPTLGERLQREGSKLDPSETNHVPRFLRCLGSASLIGVTLPQQSWNCLDDQAVATVVDWFVARYEGNSIDDERSQLWLGLREAARVVERPLRIPREMGERTLELWRAANPSEPRRQALDAEMIAWLSRCAAADWTLLPEPQPIFDLLHGKD